MKPAIRSQADDTMNEAYSKRTAISFAKAKDTARQEFKAEADVNTILRKFGAFAPMKQTRYGEAIDDNLDLQMSLEYVAEIKRAYVNLPREIRLDYPSIESFLQGAARGDFKLEDIKPETPTPDPKVDEVPS